MRILINFDPREQAFLTVLSYHIKQRGWEALTSKDVLSIGELLHKATIGKCEAIFCVNEGTLRELTTNNATLDDYRGSVLRYSIPVVIGNSLAHTQTVPEGSFLLGKDLDKIKTLHLPKFSFSFTVLESTHQFSDFFHEISSSVLISYDIETKTTEEEGEEGGDTIITCVSWTAVYACGSMHTWVLPFYNFTESHWNTREEYGQAISLLREVNALPIPKVMHNGMYDCTHSLVYRAPPRNWILDTMAMHWCQFSSMPKTLDFVASLHCHDYIQWKNEAAEASKSKDIQRYWEYNARDTFYTARICLSQLKNMPAYARKNYQMQFPMVYPAIYCNFEGIQVDTNIREELKKKHEEKLETSLSALQKILGNPSFNPGSPVQVKEYIYDILGAKDPQIGFKKDAGGARRKVQRGTDEKNLIAVGSQHPILFRVTSSIIKYREARKALSNYFEFLLKRSRLLYAINPFGTDTGRMACSSSSFWCGAQVQNIPPYAKGQLVSDPGYILAEADNSQAEARCTGYLSKEYNLTSALEHPSQDFYTSLGTLFFHIPYEQVTKDFRNSVLKKIVHGTNYMMGPGTFVENAGVENLLKASAFLNINITMEKKSIEAFASTLLEAYHVPFPNVRKWYGTVKAEIANTQMMKCPTGWTRFFFGDINKNHNLFRSAVANGPQGLNARILNKGFWKIWQLVKEERGALRLKAQIHDSILFQYKADRPELIQKVLACMDNPIQVHGRTLSIPVDYKDGPSWGNMTEHKQKK